MLNYKNKPRIKSFTRKKDLIMSFKLWVASVKSGIRLAKDFISYDYFCTNGFRFVFKNNVGVYRLSCEYIKTPTFIRTKILINSLLRKSWCYMDEFSYHKD